MIRFWTFSVGLGLILLTVINVGSGGIDLTEFRLLLAMIALLAVALVVELLGGWIEEIFADRRDLRDAMAESDRTEVEVEPEGGAVLREQASPIAATLAEVHRGGEEAMRQGFSKVSIREDPARETHRPPFSYDEGRAEAERNGDA
jgi:Flp pilus assembly pilin Flp